MNSPSTFDHSPETLEKAQCPKHGEFVRRCMRLPLADTVLKSPCPKCQEEAKAQADANHAHFAEQQAVARYQRLLEDSGIPERFIGKALAHFEAPDSKRRHVLDVASRYIVGFGENRGSSLGFCGKPGTGKTHIACAIAQAVMHTGARARFATVLRAIRTIKDTYRKDAEFSESDAIEHFTSPELLILDEVGVQVGSEHEKLLLFEIINERYQNRRATILISNLNIKELEVYLGDRVIDRIREDGAILAFDWNSYRTARKVAA